MRECAEETKSPAAFSGSIVGPGGRLSTRQARTRLTPEPTVWEDPREMGPDFGKTRARWGQMDGRSIERGNATSAGHGPVK